MAEVYPARGQVGLGVYPARQLAGSREPRRGPGRVGSGPSGSAVIALEPRPFLFYSSCKTFILYPNARPLPSEDGEMSTCKR
eukprot:1525655-Pyramimonas_sp.AAC.1